MQVEPQQMIPPKKLTWQENIHHLKMYFLLKIVMFQCHVSFQGCMWYVKSLEKTSRFNSSHVKEKSMKSSHVFLVWTFGHTSDFLDVFTVYYKGFIPKNPGIFLHIIANFIFPTWKSPFVQCPRPTNLDASVIELNADYLSWVVPKSHISSLKGSQPKITTELRFVDFFFCGGKRSANCWFGARWFGIWVGVYPRLPIPFIRGFRESKPPTQTNK